VFVRPLLTQAVDQSSKTQQAWWSDGGGWARV